MPDIVPGDATTTYSLSLGAAVTGTVDTAGDHDWYQINLTAGQTYTFQMWGSGGTPLVDTYLRIYGDTGNLQAGDDDGGPAASSYLSFTASYTGTYYISADGYGSRIGDYTLTAATDGTLPTLTTLQIADYLTGAYWYHTSNGPSAFADHSVTVDLSGLDDDGQRLARAAMATWEQVCNIDFLETTSEPAQIVFTDDSGLNASANTNSSGGTITSATIDIGRTWLDTYGTSFDSFSFQTYIYEIGRAIGLGNAGPYTGPYGEATYTYQGTQLYLNDSWAFSVMSYFNREEGGYLGGPQMADIVAAQNLYGTNYRVALGDIDGDGHTDDILWRNGNSGDVAAWLLTNGADTQTVGLGARSLDWQIAGVGDFDADGGNDDILWHNSTSGAVTTWSLSDGVVTQLSGNDAAPLDWQIAGVGDFDADGHTDDILWRNSNTGAVAIWSWSDGVVTQVTDAGAASLDWQIAGVGDFDGDGHTDDILWRNSDNGSVAAWFLSNGVATQVVQTGAASLDWQIAGIGDFDGDGFDDDILWHNANYGALATWSLTNGVVTQITETGATSLDWQVAGVGDLDADGHNDDILLHNSMYGTLAAWSLTDGVASQVLPTGAATHDWLVA